MKLLNKIVLSSLSVISFSSFSYAQDSAINSFFVKDDLATPKIDAVFWKKAKVYSIGLSAQPITTPRPKTTLTSQIKVQSVYNKSWISFRLNWKDTEKSEGQVVNTFSDGVAMQFPTKIVGGNPPSAFMGEVGNPVHIFHWKTAFQLDKEKGFHDMKDIYPNASIDMYPLDPKIEGNYPKATEEEKMAFVHAQAAGNPQAFPKVKGMDEIFAEGFGTSQVIDNHEAIATGSWKNGEWTVVISRPLKSKVGSKLEVGKPNFMAFAVWQGGKNAVGSRKDLTLAWIPLNISGKN